MATDVSSLELHSTCMRALKLFQKSDLFAQYNEPYELHLVWPKLYLKLRFEPQIATVQIRVVTPMGPHG